jgi:TonB family protein
MPAGLCQDKARSAESRTAPLPRGSENQTFPSNSAEADLLHSQVVKLFREKKFAEALPLARRVLALREAAKPPQMDKTTAAEINLAEVLIGLQKLGDATSLYERLLKESEASDGVNSIKAAPLMDRLAWLKYQQLENSKAKAYYEKSLSIRSSAFGGEHIEVARADFNLAEFLRLTRDYKKAEPLYLHAIEVDAKILPPGSADLNQAVAKYGCLLYETGRSAELEPFKTKFSSMLDPRADDGPRGEVLNGRALKLVPPAFPEVARRNRIGGTVVIKVTMDEAGNVIDAKNECGAWSVLAKASQDAALQSKVTPTLVGGQAVKATGMIVYHFKF